MTCDALVAYSRDSGLGVEDGVWASFDGAARSGGVSLEPAPVAETTSHGLKLVDSDNYEQSIREARQGDVAAFERLYRHFVDQIYGLCLRMTASHTDAEECVQTTFIKAWRWLDRFEGRSDFGTWLHRIAVNEVLMESRSRGRFESMEEPLERSPPWTSGTDTTLELEEAIAALPERARQVFVLRAIYGHTHEEISTLMGIETGTARAHYHHARQVLKRQLGLEEQDESTAGS